MCDKKEMQWSGSPAAAWRAIDTERVVASGVNFVSISLPRDMTFGEFIARPDGIGARYAEVKE